MVRPIRNNVLVKPFPPDEVSANGIFIPESVREISNKVLIVDVGNGTASEPMQLKKGQTAFRVKGWTGTMETELMINGQIHYIIEQSAILATA